MMNSIGSLASRISDASFRNREIRGGQSSNAYTLCAPPPGFAHAA
jgi:hypothetical protein